MSAQHADITIDRGADYAEPLPPILDPQGNPVDITSETAVMQIRTSYDDPDALLTLTTENSGLVISGPQGIITPIISFIVTAAFLPSSYVYDVYRRTIAGKIIRSHEGRATVPPRVTQVYPASGAAYTDASGNPYTDASGNAYSS